MKKRILSLVLALSMCASLALPASAASDNSIKQVEAGYLFSMVVTNGGDLYGFGLNTDEGLPLGPDRDMITDPRSGAGNIVPRPQKITENVVKVASSKSPSSQGVGSFVAGGHSLILKEGGQLYGLGDNYCGQLGQGDRKQHPGLQYIMGNVREISCSGTASFAITNNGDLYWWGLLMEQNSGRAEYLFEPSPVKLMSNVKDVDGGAEHVVILEEDGTVWCMGAAYAGAVGNGEQYGFVDEPYYVFSDSTIESVGAGCSYSVALSADGTLYGWGETMSGQLNQPYEVNEVYTPTVVLTGVKSVECGYYSTHVIKEDDSLWGMGWNFHGELGRGKETTVNTAKKTLDNVVSVSGGYFHTLVLKKDGGMFGCGQSYYYELGNGTSDYQVLSWIPAGLTASPIQDGSNPFTDVKSGDYFYDSVLWALEQYITTGTTATTFSPAKNCTRAQIITFLHRAAGSPDAFAGDNQKDVGPGDWFVESACWANEMGMFANTGGYFRPNDACTRGAAVEFMWYAAGAPAYDTSSLPFTDVKRSASYAQAVAWALDNGVTTGTSATTFSPNSACTRGQIVTFLNRAFG